MPDANELRRRDAERAHNNHAEFVKGMNSAAIQAGEVALRTAVLINGGAAVAILAFVGAIAAKDKIDIAQVSAIARAIVWFAAGVAASGLGLGLAYLTNYSNVRAADTQTLSWQHPYVVPGSATKRWERCTLFFHVCAIVAGLASFGFFIVGMWGVRTAILELATKS